MMRANFPPLYVIVDAELVRGPAAGFAAKMAEAGAGLLQYRNKRGTTRQIFETSREIAGRLARLPRDKHAVRFVVNDRADVAMLAGAGGVHVGQTDLPVEDARAIVGGEAWVGVSTHSLEQVAAAENSSADYVAFGPIFPTATKENPDPVVGLELLAKARALTRKPLVAIGGITLERAAEVYRAGADSLAVVRDVVCAETPEERVGAYLEAAARAGPRESGR